MVSYSCFEPAAKGVSHAANANHVPSVFPVRPDRGGPGGRRWPVGARHGGARLDPDRLRAGVDALRLRRLRPDRGAPGQRAQSLLGYLRARHHPADGRRRHRVHLGRPRLVDPEHRRPRLHRRLAPRRPELSPTRGGLYHRLRVN